MLANGDAPAASGPMATRLPLPTPRLKEARELVALPEGSQLPLASRAKAGRLSGWGEVCANPDSLLSA